MIRQRDVYAPAGAFFLQEKETAKICRVKNVKLIGLEAQNPSGLYPKIYRIIIEKSIGMVYNN